MGPEGGGGGGRNKNGTLMRAGCRLVRAFTIPLEQSPYRRRRSSGYSASEVRLVLLVGISVCDTE